MRQSSAHPPLPGNFRINSKNNNIKMKTKFVYAALMMGAMVVACSPKADEAVEAADEEVVEAVKTARDYVPSKAFVDSVSYLIGVNFGSFIKGYDFGDVNYAQIKKGMQDFVNAEGDMRDPEFGEQFKINPDQINDLFNRYLEERHNYKLLSNKEAGEKFLAKNKNAKDVVETESGLQYRILAAGTDVRPEAVDTVWVHYVGKTLDGKVFDQVADDAEPVQFTLNHVIAGWTEGIQLIGEGGEIELFIPADLAYGERGNQGIDPNSTLVFNVKLDKVGKFVAEEETPAE